MTDPYAKIVRIAEVDAASGAEDPRSVCFGVVAGDEHSYAVTRSANTLDELAGLVGGDLTDERALWEHAAYHHPSLGDYPKAA